MGLPIRSKVTKAIGAAAVLAVAGLLAMPNSAKAQEETFSLVGTIPIPGLTSFDISWVASTTNFSSGDNFGDANGTYFLADRTNKSVDEVPLTSGSVSYLTGARFVGLASGGSDFSGPNGVETFDNTASNAGSEIWAGDGPQANAGCPSYSNGVCSAVKVMASSGALTHVIVTNGAARADEMCYDQKDGLMLVANDAEADFSYGTPFISWISTNNYKIVAQLLFDGKAGDGPKATNGIEQCKYDSETGYFFLNLPEVNGPGNDTADGEVVVMQPPTAANKYTPTIVATYIIPTADCAGPQGMAIGAEPQLLLGCGGKGPNGVYNSVIINKHTGALLAIGWGLGGGDESWANPGDAHYYITGSSLPSPALAVVDGTGAGAVDAIISTPKYDTASPHSVAGGGNWMGSNPNSFFVPTAGGVLVFAPSTADSDDPGFTAPPYEN